MDQDNQLEVVGGKKVAKLSAASLTPEVLWQDFISKRIPVLIEGYMDEALWSAHEKWNEQYLAKRAGNCDVRIEKRGGKTEKFGRGKKMTMKFKEFLNRVEKGDETLYLSPQEAPMGWDGIPDVVCPPVSHLQNDFPMRPKLMGALVPHQINMWMGTAAEGSSSGLHHDFHDNLYILMNGKKTFNLFSPVFARGMYTVGDIDKVYENGRIVYTGQLPVLADGSVVENVEAFQRYKSARDELAAAETAQDTDLIHEAKEVLEALMDEALDRALDDECLVAFESSSEDETCAIENIHEQGKLMGGEPEVDHEEPLNFSKVDVSLPKDEIVKCFPRFPLEKNQRFTCEVEEGNMLFLPAGWFHEVTSSNTSSKYHFALNYWYHPPDNLDNGVENPYASDYWETRWTECVSNDHIGMKVGENDARTPLQHCHDLTLPETGHGSKKEICSTSVSDERRKKARKNN